jgi:putative DNA primase/helicase
LRAGVLMAARVNKIQPGGRPDPSQPWDTKPRLRYWLAECLRASKQRPYTALIGALFIKGMVAARDAPWLQVRLHADPQGEQGAQKSTMFRLLAEPWFTDNAIRMGDKDSLLALQSSGSRSRRA